MDSSRLIAQRYTKAFFALATERKAEGAVWSDLSSLLELSRSDKKFGDFLVSPLIARKQSAQALDAVLIKTGAHDITRAFFRLLAAQRRLGLLAYIVSEFEAMMTASRGELSAEVITAAPLKDAEQKSIAASLAKATGKTVRIKPSVNPALLGGLIVKIGGKMLDHSIAGKLARLSQRLHTT